MQNANKEKIHHAMFKVRLWLNTLWFIAVLVKLYAIFCVANTSLFLTGSPVAAFFITLGVIILLIVAGALAPSYKPTKEFQEILEEIDKKIEEGGDVSEEPSEGPAVSVKIKRHPSSKVKSIYDIASEESDKFNKL